LCCLRYEHDFYVTSRKRFPKEGKILTTARGLEKVQAVDIFRERVLLRAEDGSTRPLALAELKQELETAQSTRVEKTKPPPSGLVTFDEGETAVTPEQVVESIRPKSGQRKRRRRGRRGGRNRHNRDNDSGGADSSPPKRPDDA
jgi:hypothetical protein